MPSPSAAFDIFPIVFAIVAVFILVVFVVVIVALVRSSRRLKRVGRDPMTLQADLASQALDSQLLAPAQTAETRLNDSGGCCIPAGH